MEALQLTLANGDVAQADSLRTYFGKIFEAEDSGAEFPVNLEHVWRVGYGRKSDAVHALRRDFIEGADFEVLRQIPQNSDGGRPVEIYNLTTSCMEYLAVRANRAVFEVYRACRKAVRKAVALLPDFTNPVAAARAWADEREARQLAEAGAATMQQQLIEAQPAVETVKALMDAGTNLSMTEVAKTLAVKGIGRNNLYNLLRKQGVVQPFPSTEPYQRHVDNGHFVRRQVPYTVNGERRLNGKTLVTPLGVAFIQRMLAKKGEVKTSL